MHLNGISSRSHTHLKQWYENNEHLKQLREMHISGKECNKISKPSNVPLGRIRSINKKWKADSTTQSDTKQVLIFPKELSIYTKKGIGQRSHPGCTKGRGLSDTGPCWKLMKIHRQWVQEKHELCITMKHKSKMQKYPSLVFISVVPVTRLKTSTGLPSKSQSLGDERGCFFCYS